MIRKGFVLLAAVWLFVMMPVSCASNPGKYAYTLSFLEDSSKSALETFLPEEFESEEASQTETSSAAASSIPNKVTKNPKYQPTGDPKKDEDGGYNRSNQQEEEIKDTLPEITSSSQESSGQTDELSSDDLSPGDVSSDLPPKDGWNTINGFTYYYYDGKPVTGWQTMGGKKYFFSPSGILSSTFGIDVSEHQGEINWKKVKAANVDFAMIRVGYRGYGSAGNLKIDRWFEYNITNAMANGIKCGVYFYTQAITVQEAIEEANLTLDALRDVGVTPAKLAYPVAFDIEDAEVGTAARTYTLNNTQRTNFCIAFSDTIKNAGFRPMVYANKYWLTTKLEITHLSLYDIWLAHYTNQTDYTGSYKMWQYTNTGNIDGITGNVDLNVSFY